MSQADVERFVSDLKSDPTLLEGLKGEAAGIASVISYANAKGYDISVEEAKSYIANQVKQELSDEQLDAVAGGKSGGANASIAPETSVTAVIDGAVAVSNITSNASSSASTNVAVVIDGAVAAVNIT